MILDTLENASLYFSLNPGIDAAADWLKNNNLPEIPDGRVDLENGVYVTVQSYQTKSVMEKRWEAHRKYIDLQCVVTGGEWFGYAPLDTLVVVDPYAGEKDVLLLEGGGKFLRLEAGQFVIFFPNDAHLPGIHHDSPEQVKKAVFKLPFKGFSE